MFDRFVKGKKMPALLQRIGVKLPPVMQKPLIWIHGVSVGEIKAAQTIYQKLKAACPEYAFFITTTTQTGQEEARRSLPEAEAYAYLPFDFKWLVRLWVKRLQPRFFFLMESDFWPNLLKEIEKSGGKNVLLNGKLSERSARRFRWVSFFARSLFDRFALLCVQNEEYFRRFSPLLSHPDRMHVTGNLKLDLTPQKIDMPFWKERFKGSTRPLIAISCTHHPEEELLLNALAQGPWTLFLAPRHPERFKEVEMLLQQKKISYQTWSRLLEGASYAEEEVILVDAMGQLPICYSLSRLAIVGGSFIDSVGGHNILEPCLYGIPSFFGPYMFSQKELVQRALQAQAGKQLPLSDLRSQVETFFSQPPLQNQMGLAVKKLMEVSRGSSDRTFHLLKSLHLATDERNDLPGH